MASKRENKLPISGRDTPETPSWIYESGFLLEAGTSSLKTETTYRSGLRLFADWLQHFNREGYSVEEEWPLKPDPTNNGRYPHLPQLASRKSLTFNRNDLYFGRYWVSKLSRRARPASRHGPARQATAPAIQTTSGTQSR